MDHEQLSATLGEMRAEIRHVHSRLDQHVAQEGLWQGEMRESVDEIKNLLSQATGAKRLFVWLLALFFGAAALAKTWFFGR